MAPLLVLALAAAPAPYKAMGTEPFWNLTIEPREMTFDLAGMLKVRQATRPPRKTRYGKVYRTRRISVAIMKNKPCSDGMSDYIYRDDVKVIVDGKTFIGCGGPRHLPSGAPRP